MSAKKKNVCWILESNYANHQTRLVLYNKTKRLPILPNKRPLEQIQGNHSLPGQDNAIKILENTQELAQ